MNKLFCSATILFVMAPAGMAQEPECYDPGRYSYEGPSLADYARRYLVPAYRQEPHCVARRRTMIPLGLQTFLHRKMQFDAQAAAQAGGIAGLAQFKADRSEIRRALLAAGYNPWSRPIKKYEPYRPENEGQ